MRTRVVTALLAAFSLLLFVLLSAAAAPIDTPSDDRNQVMAITALVALGMLALAGIGFLYRRMKGMVHPPEDTTHPAGHH